jgi:hypothetical protein
MDSKNLENASDPSLKEKILLLRDMTRRTGVLHEFQVENLKYWFFMLYSEVDKFEIMFDFEKSTLTYKVLSTKDSEAFHKNNNFNTLSEYVKFLLGQNTVVKVVSEPNV